MSNLDQEEANAIRDIVHEALPVHVAEIAARDFAQPRRLSARRLSTISSRISASFQDIAGRARQLLRDTPRISLSQLNEVNAARALDDLDDFVLHAFSSDGARGWLVWDRAFATAASEKILSGLFEGEPQSRRLSPSELCVIDELLSIVVRRILANLELAYESVGTVQDIEDLVDVGPPSGESDLPRVYAHIQFEGVGGTSDMRLYLPGFSPEQKRSTGGGITLPEHLDGVSVSLQAYLGSVDIPLTELLALEIGDVIPLGVRAGSPVQLYVEDRVCGSATWGKHDGSLAVRVNEIDPRNGDIDRPAENTKVSP